MSTITTTVTTTLVELPPERKIINCPSCGRGSSATASVGRYHCFECQAGGVWPIPPSEIEQLADFLMELYTTETQIGCVKASSRSFGTSFGDGDYLIRIEPV